MDPNTSDEPTMYRLGERYSRADIYRTLGIPAAKQGGDWLNGYHRHGSDYYIFCNVGTVGRTGHDYENRWDGETLIWYGKTTSTCDQTSIQNLISGHYRVLIFFRSDDRSEFQFAGLGTPNPHRDSSRPVRIDWTLGPLTTITP